jgi:hypothetical protein
MATKNQPPKQEKGTIEIKAEASHHPMEKKRGASTTRIIVKYDAGFGNALYIRGKGANLNWNRGIMLRNVKPDEWHWETDLPFNECEFKVLINDQCYEIGDNHPLTAGSSIQYTPKF